MRRVSEKSLMNAALFHLARYSASVKQMHTVLWRKAQRALKTQKPSKNRERVSDPVAAKALVGTVVERLVRAGYLDDARLAESKAGALRRSGKSSRVIAQKLMLKGLGRELVAEHSKTSAEQELEAAWVLARKKRLGPYARPARPSVAGRKLLTERDVRQKHIAALCRAGFSYSLARQVVEAPSPPAHLDA